MSNYITAIDLGSYKVATIVGEKRDTEVIVVGYSEVPSEGIVRGEVLNIQKATDCISKTINQIEAQIGDPDFRIDTLYVGISIHNLKCAQDTTSITRVSSSEITSKEISDMLSKILNKSIGTNEKVIHVVAQCYNIDDENMGIKDPVGVCGKEVTGIYKLFIGKKESSSNTDKVLKRLSITPTKEILTPLASARAILTKEDMELGVAMIDIGGGTTDLVIYKDNLLQHIAILPIAGNSITEDIRQVCGIPYRFAEKIKKDYGTALSEYASEKKTILVENTDGTFTKRFPLGLLAQTIEARLREIIATIYQEINTVIPIEKLGSGIVLTGGCANTTLIQYLTKKLTKTDVKIAFPDSTKVKSSIDANFYNTKASTVIGLLLTASDEFEETSTINPLDTQPQTIFDINTIPTKEEKKESEEKTIKEPEKKKEKPKKEKRGGFFGDFFFTDSDKTEDNEA